MTIKNFKRINPTRTYSVRNDQRVRVKKCCASCMHREIQADGSRVCSLMEIIRGAKDCCPNWEMTLGLRHAGKPYGRVKSKEYLRHVITTREIEDIAIQEGRLQEIDRASLEDIREKFREQHGSEYVIQ